MQTGAVRIGIGGWTYAPWRGPFYPEGHPQKQELAFASRALTSIEINGTFYRAPSSETFANWHDSTPDDFVFALKAPRYVTHRRSLSEAGESVARFIEGGLRALKAKLGPINWQFPQTKRFDPEELAAFLDLLPRELDGRPLRHAVEVRHESFLVPEAVSLARAHEVALVTAADGHYPHISDVTGSFVYARLMGTQEGHAAGYPPNRLDRWAETIGVWAAGRTPEVPARLTPPAKETPRDVYAYVIGGHKVANPAAARALIERLS